MGVCRAEHGRGRVERGRGRGGGHQLEADLHLHREGLLLSLCLVVTPPGDSHCTLASIITLVSYFYGV